MNLSWFDMHKNKWIVSLLQERMEREDHEDRPGKEDNVVKQASPDHRDHQEPGVCRVYQDHQDPRVPAEDPVCPESAAHRVSLDNLDLQEQLVNEVCCREDSPSDKAGQILAVVYIPNGAVSFYKIFIPSIFHQNRTKCQF